MRGDITTDVLSSDVFYPLAAASLQPLQSLCNAVLTDLRLPRSALANRLGPLLDLNMEATRDRDGKRVRKLLTSMPLPSICIGICEARDLNLKDEESERDFRVSINISYEFARDELAAAFAVNTSLNALAA